MNPKFLILYIIAGSLAVILVVYQLVASSAVANTSRLVVNILMALFFFYLAYKTYHEKKDKELM